MNNVRFALVIASLLCLSLLVGCGDEADSDDNAAVNNAPANNEPSNNEPANNDPPDAVGFSIEPPAWLLGMWQGDSGDGQVVAIMDADNISFGDVVDGAQVDITPFGSFVLLDPDATFTVLEDEADTYAYTIAFNDGQSDIEFTDTFVDNGDGTMNYTFEFGGMVVADFVMTRTPAADFIVPPSWLRGRWEGVATDGTAKVAVFDDNDVSFGDVVDGDEGLTSFGMLLGFSDASTWRVQADDGSRYVYTLSTSGPDGPIIFTDTFVDNGDGTMEYTFEFGGMVVDQFTMSRL